MIRAVLDTNVIVSALISAGKPRELLRKGIVNEINIITSKELLEELASVLSRPTFKMSQDEIRRIIIDIMQISEILVSESKFEVIEEDPDDDIVLNVAYDSRADYIVSGDKHLLKLREFKGTKIVSVKGILTILQQ
jgi:hypothetical protein